MKLHPKANTKTEITLEDKKVMTAKFRLSYPHLFKPQVFKNGTGDPKYSISMLFGKDIDLSALHIAASNAAIEMWGSDPKKWPSKKIKLKDGRVVSKCIVESPFKDGDKEKPDKPEYENQVYVGASSKKGPGICDNSKPPQPILAQEDIKAGDWCRATLIAFAYPQDGKGPKVGVSFALINVQKLRDGEPLGGGRSAEADFADAPVDEDEEENEDVESDDEESEDDDTPEY